jgi:crotonobetainyl-CoA:carnitine CoA-transferase CaiB-like acyl-CoA transferase
MAATLMAVNERAHFDLAGDDIGAEPAVLGATDCPFFLGPDGEEFTVATSIVGSLTFPSWMRAMRRADLIDDPRFATAEARRANFKDLHAIIQGWILSFPDAASLDAQFDEAKIAMGKVRSIRELADSEWSAYWSATQEVSDRHGGSYRLPGRPWRFSEDALAPLGEPAFQGEHNQSVFEELGLTPDEISGHTRSGALVCRVPKNRSPT